MIGFRGCLTAWKRFGAAREGATAPIFAVLALVLVFLAGVSIDVSRAVTNRTQLQAAADAAALAAASARLDDVGDVAKVARDAFNAHIPAPDLFDQLSVDVQVNDIQGTVEVTGTAQTKTTLARVMGPDFMEISAFSMAVSGVEQTEIVLALDQSGSMLGSRQNSLEQAIEDFTAIVFEGESSLDDLYVGIVPWQTTVNIGTENADWLQGLEPSTVDFPSNMSENAVIQTLANIDYDAQGYEGFDPTFDDYEDAFDDEDIDDDDYPTLAWRGCVLVRDRIETDNFSQDDFDRSVTGDRSNLPTDVSVLRRPIGDDRFYMMYQPIDWGNGDGGNGSGRRNGSNRRLTWSNFGDGRTQHNPNSGCLRQPMTYLSNQRASLNAAANALDPADDDGAHTDTSHGMIWALRMLNPDWRTDWNGGTPVDVPGAFDDPETGKIIVLMTDGVNGISNNTFPQSWSAYLDTRDSLDSSIDRNNDQAQARLRLNIRTLRLCEMAKNMGVEIFTIGFDVGNNGQVREMLNNCASSDDHFLLASGGGQLRDAFESIARQIRSVRLAQ
ncbi:MAG: TadE/TadG family type IV pilus assembly protein [Maricaulaceae bacterium]